MPDLVPALGRRRPRVPAPPMGWPRSGVRLVATDLDGTLLSPAGIVSDRTAAAVRAARAAGIHVVPATGRPPKSVWDLAAGAGLGPLGVCSNGAALIDFATATVIATDEIDPVAALQIVAAVRAVAADARFAIDDLNCFTHELDFFDAAVDWDEEMAVVADIITAVQPGMIQLIARRPGWSATAFMATLAPVLGERVWMTTSGLDWIHLGLPLISKASRLAAVCAGLGIDAASVVAVGDHHNDLSMLGWAGTSMAVANAVPEVLAAVDRVLPSNAEDGVACLLEELVDAASGAGTVPLTSPPREGR